YHVFFFFFLHFFFFLCFLAHLYLHSFPTRRSSDLIYSQVGEALRRPAGTNLLGNRRYKIRTMIGDGESQSAFRMVTYVDAIQPRSEEHTSELQSLAYLVCRLLLEKKKKKNTNNTNT